MKNIRRMGLSLISASLLAATAGAVPATLSSTAPAPQTAKGSTQLQSVSGTISTVQRDSFTLVASTAAPQGEQFQEDRNPGRTMMFVIDQNTSVDGKLKVGANADVIFRQDTGNDIAVSVTVAK
jgi:Cu/Ag efflux protein CusF